MTPDDEEPGFDDFDKADEALEELRARILRLHAELDQTAASVDDQRIQMDELRTRIEALERDIKALKTQMPRTLRLTVWTERCVWFTAGTLVATLLWLL